MARRKSSKATRTGTRSKAPRTRKQTSTAPRRVPPPAATLTHRQLTERYNALIPRALALGITAVANSKVRPAHVGLPHERTGRAHHRRAGGAIAAAQRAELPPAHGAGSDRGHCSDG
jgi:hypothetical protein